MNVLERGTSAPSVSVVSLAGASLPLHDAVASVPLLLVFGMPHVHASRLVVGYARRLKETVPDVGVWIVLQGDDALVREYASGYLERVEGLVTVHDASLEASEAFGVTHVPTTYYLVPGGDGGMPKVEVSFSGFGRSALNRIAALAAEATGAKPKELVTALDNKGEYELAERALSRR